MLTASLESEDGGELLRVAIPPRSEHLHAIRQLLDGMDLAEDTLRDATLLTTELVTNSIRHADLSPDDLIEVTAVRSGSRLRITVRDRGSVRPPAHVLAGSIRPTPGARSGWGLYLVDRLASRWGTDLGDTVGFWFELEERPGRERDA
ncbi:MAG TPA: ATP-binding protein [Actinomycetota bacterium]|nr:ATP-binding protein [Actinomycetota bacterium]